MTQDKLVDITVDKNGMSGAKALGITVDKDRRSGAASGQSRRSVLLIVSLLALSLLAWAATSAYGAGIGAGAGAGGTGAGSETTVYLAQVSDGNGNVYQLPLEYDTRLEVKTALGINIVVVNNGEVFVEEADCPGEDCLRQGGISRPGQTIVCLPHRLVVQIVAVSGQSEGGGVGGAPSDSNGNGNTGSGQSGDSADGNNGSGQGGSNAGTNNTGQQPPIVDAISE